MFFNKLVNLRTDLTRFSSWMVLEVMIRRISENALRQFYASADASNHILGHGYHTCHNIKIWNLSPHYIRQNCRTNYKGK